jgi:bifunctional pyridoxal-dependent enzyme with beta-cystathionase and maltose regulon repressor activities
MGYWESAPLKARICRHYAETYGVTVEPMQITLTCGASPALVLALSATFSPGDVIAMARPGYVAYRNSVRALHMVPLEIPCGPETRFQLTAETLAALDPAPAGVILASPPTRPARSSRPPSWRRSPGLPHPRHPHHLRRDLPRPQLRRAARSMLEFEPRASS